MSVVAEGLFSELMQFRNRIPLPNLYRWLEASTITINDVRQFCRFHPERYVRNLMYQGPAFQALVLCWRNGQRSPIHDHKGSSCAVKVLSGMCYETIFEHAPNGLIYPTVTRQMAEGHITASQDTDIHQISNLQANGADLITLHIYSPPLLAMNTYSLINSKVSTFVDPINEVLVEGAGI